MFCMSCGTQLPADAAFCYKCGNKTAPPQKEPEKKSDATHDLIMTFIENRLAILQRNYPQEVDKNRIEEIQRAILEKIVASLRNGNLDSTDVPRISDFVLEDMKGITYEWQIASFIDRLQLGWPAFEGLWDEVKKQ